MALGAISYVMGAGFVLATSLGLGAGTVALLRAGRPKFLEFLLWAVFLFWQMIPVLFEGFSPGLNFREVARYPISFRLYFLLNAAYGLFDPAAATGLVWLLSIWLGIVFARPEWALPAAGLFAGFAAFNVLCNRIVMGMLERFQSTRKGRERLAVVLLILMLVPQTVNLMVNGWINVHRLRLPQWTRDVVVAVRQISPPGLVVESMESEAVARVAPLALLASYFLLAALWQVRQLRAVYLGEIYAESFKAQRELNVRPGWRLPGMSGSMSAVVEKELRYIRQNVRLIVLLINPLILCAFLAFGTRTFSLGRGANILGVFALLLAVSVSNLSYNTFGMDREAFGRWLLAPLPLQKVMQAKNIAQGALMTVVYVIGATAILTIRRVPLDMLAAVTAGFFSLLIIHLAAGNLFSVYWPKRIEFTQVNTRMASSAAGFASMLVVLPLVAVIGIVVLATWFWKLTWLPLVAGLAALAVSLKIYSWLSNRAANYAQDHLEEIAGALGV